ncbi:unnamed protein product [Effrenium voratum]|uniref:Uncharacterized protein n=1 Tax=Effrenium voratum TaxID=2562239 RepID=A0AA36HYY5_9DINO|nr:unnamed protein product [Effrenium voratum]
MADEWLQMDVTPPLPKNWKVRTSGEQRGDAEDNAILGRVEALERSLSQLKRKLEASEVRMDDQEAVRRGQLDCLSERIYQAEKTQRQVQERTDDAIEKARGAFQKTASDMEHERANLMCVITQVNTNFEHLSRELSQLSDHVTRTQQELLQLQQEVAERCLEDKTGFAHQLANLEEHHGAHLQKLRDSQRLISQQVVEMQCQLRPLMDQERSQKSFSQEVSAYLEDLARNARDSEAHRQQLGEQIARVQKEALRGIDDLRQQLQEQLNEALRKDRPLEELPRASLPARVPGFRNEDAKRWLDGERHRTFSGDREEKASPWPEREGVPAWKGQPFPQVDSLMGHDLPELPRDHRMLELLLKDDDWQPVSQRWSPPDATSLPAPKGLQEQSL